MRSKKDCQRDHTKRRMQERYGLRFSQYVRDSIIHEIRAGNAKLVLKQSNRVSIFDVNLKVRPEDSVGAPVGDLLVRVVYDRHRKNMATVLSMDMDPWELEA